MTSRRWGGALWVGCVQFFVSEAVAAAGFLGSYSFRRNYISDLGAMNCSGGCSPLHALMNASFVLQGALIVTGAAVVWAPGSSGPRTSAVIEGAAGQGDGKSRRPLYCYAAPSRRPSSASTRSSASRKACALPTVPELSFAGVAPRGSPLPRISRA